MAPSVDDTPEWAASDPEQGQTYAEFMRDGQWIWLYQTAGNRRAHSIGRYSALLTQERIDRGVRDSGWDAHVGDGSPGFSGFRTETGAWEHVYERYDVDGIELLVLVRDYHGAKPESVELAEEFRLLFNLWQQPGTGLYFLIGDSGEAVKAAEAGPEGIRVLTSLVRRYQAAKQLHLALYLDSTNYSDNLTVDGGSDYSWVRDDDASFIEYWRSAAPRFTKPLSRLWGKRLFPPPPVETCDIAPFEAEKTYEEFIIGTDGDGAAVTFTSDPEQLANYFGKNPDAPHYLTFVFFRKEVLGKYYGNELYTVEDGYIRCARIWGLRVDNDLPDHVMVFLGDLGRDIPQEEALYWRSFNVAPPDSGPSQTLIRRAFDAEFAEASSPALRFPRAYRAANAAWASAFGYELFRPLHRDDQHVLDRLRVPLGDSQAEFDEEVGYLSKLLVDCLNEREIVARIGKGPGNEGGLKKLQRLLDTLGVEQPRLTLEPFAKVQALRSRGAAHAKGSEYDITVAIGNATRSAGFEKLLADAIITLEVLRATADKAGEPS